MCLYVEKRNYGITNKDIPCIKVVYKGKDGLYYPYFSQHSPIEFDTLLINDKPIKVVQTESHFPYKLMVDSGVFHTYHPDTLQLILPIIAEEPNTFIINAVIPKGTPYFIGFCHGFTLNIEKAYGSSKIIYKDIRTI